MISRFLNLSNDFSQGVTVHSYLVPVTDFADASHSKSAKSAATTVSYGIFSSENACLWTVTIQILLFWESSLIHNAEFAVDLSPVPNAHSPFFSGFESCQIQGFQERCITWKYASLTVELTVGRIQTFDCIGRVNNLSDIRWELENRRYCIPVIIPAFHRIRVFCGPFFSNTIQSQSSLFFSSFRTDSQYFELSLSPTVIERTSFFPSVLMPRMT